MRTAILWFLLLSSRMGYSARAVALAPLKFMSTDFEMGHVGAGLSFVVTCESLSDGSQTVTGTFENSTLDIAVLVLNQTGISGWTKSGAILTANLRGTYDKVVTLILPSKGSTGILDFSKTCFYRSNGPDCTGLATQFAASTPSACGPTNNCAYSGWAAMFGNLKLTVTPDRGAVLCSAAGSAGLTAALYHTDQMINYPINSGRPF